MAQSKKSRFLLLAILFGTMFLFGFLENIKGVSYPLIKNEFGVSYETQGKMISVLSVCYTLFVVFSGFMLGRWGIKKVYLLGLFFAFLGAASVYFMSGYWAVSAALLLIFAGFGIFEIGVNGAAVRLFTQKAALMMNLLHFMYGLGAIISPRAAGMLVNPAGPGLGWRQVYLFTVPLALVILVPALFARFPRHDEDAAAEDAAAVSAAVSAAAETAVAETGGAEKGGAEKPGGFIAALRIPAVWVFGVTLGLAMGLEMASSNWGGLYFQDVYGMDPATRGAGFVSSFFMLFTLSRLVSGFVIEKVGYMKSLFGAVLLMGIIFAAGFSLGAAGIYVLPLLGFVIAILWPTLMAVAMGHFGGHAAVMTAAIIAIGGLLNALMQLSMGYINRWLGAAWGYRSCLVFTVVLLWMLLRLRRRVRGAQH
jgi:fucose permease